MNKIIITGRLTRDPELNTTSDGIEYAKFGVAVNRRANKSGEKQADFFDCVAWRQNGAFIAKYYHKGDGIELCGAMESRKYTDKEGNNRIGWTLRVEEADFPKGRAADGQSGSNYSAPSTSSAAVPNYTAPAEGMVDIDGDDDLPF